MLTSLLDFMKGSANLLLGDGGGHADSWNMEPLLEAWARKREGVGDCWLADRVWRELGLLL